MRYPTILCWQDMCWVPRQQGVQRRDESVATSDRQMGLQKEETGINYSDRLLLEIEIAS